VLTVRRSGIATVPQADAANQRITDALGTTEPEPGPGDEGDADPVSAEPADAAVLQIQHGRLLRVLAEDRPEGRPG
jgi:hypothetical protein